MDSMNEEQNWPLHFVKPSGDGWGVFDRSETLLHKCQSEMAADAWADVLNSGPVPTVAPTGRWA